ncbi:MAG: bifunctional D-glycero-beta-D-manno-heptose-7-phosphate kinase/D-glycero-beta-D-manno-heptose 1-phosphate adenylyltransferase HldE [Gammaproteobacteria bacterium]|nr:bifunctional D-glycero-beta-D-manno-heptose-7-phosphate kinase/D-glycero-beta-D-manno-heptose 1-phosphate adenylyltransferase HldE [Gammaproteobacteria bacterium]
MTLRIPDFSSVKALVAGDVMLDRYWYGGTGRISPEAPVPVVRVGKREDRPGGAGNVAGNIVALGGKCRLLGIIGDDDEGRSLRDGLKSAGVEDALVSQAGIHTTTKLRVISRQQQLIRMDFEDDAQAFEAKGLASAFPGALDNTDVVILSDYAKGALADPQPLIRAAKDAGVPLLVDPKGTDFTRYAGATLLTPNLGEFEAVVGACPDDDTLVARGEALRKELKLKYLVVTRSEQGMTIISDGDPLHLPALAREVYDVTGAGDTVISLLAAGLGAGMSIGDAAALANLGAGIVVGKVGTASVSTTELRLALKHQLGGADGILDEDELAEAVVQARQHGERIVMTNGCFDLMHAGHVAYLQEARALGDRLIVAVNDDDSVRRLKGKDRPVMPLEQRMKVLAALDAVDWVVAFSEDTPARVIGRVLPDFLVKGGDYKPEDIAGYDAVTGAGGEVRVLRFEDGISTSDIIRRIRGE